MVNQANLEKAISIIEYMQQSEKLTQEEKDRLMSAKNDLLKIYKGR